MSDKEGVTSGKGYKNQRSSSAPSSSSFHSGSSDVLVAPGLSWEAIVRSMLIFSKVVETVGANCSLSMLDCVGPQVSVFKRMYGLGLVMDGQQEMYDGIACISCSR